MSFWNKLERPAFEPFPEYPRYPQADEPPPSGLGGEPSLAGEQHADRPPERSSPGPGSPGTGPDALIGRGVRLEGKLTLSGAVRIDATVKGSIDTDGLLLVGAEAKLDAEIVCATLIVEGEVNGDVTASESVELRPTAVLRGKVEAPSLAVERGAIFEGTSRRPPEIASLDAARSSRN